MGRALGAIETFLSHPILWGVIALVALAIALSGKLSVNAAGIVLWVAYAAAVFGVFRAEEPLKNDPLLKYLVLGAIACGLAVGALLLQRWLVSKPHVETVSVQSNPTPAPLEINSDNVEENIRGWLSDFKYPVQKIDDPVCHFRLDVRVLQNLEIAVERTKDRDKYIVLAVALTFTPVQKSQFSKLSKKQLLQLNDEVGLDMTPDFQFELHQTNLQACAVIYVYAGLNAMRPLWRSVPNG